VLGVARDATTEEIRRAWVARARVFHPDAGGDDDVRMREVNDAWHALRDPSRRLAHDRELGIDHGPRYALPDDAVYAPWEPPPTPLAEQVDERSTRASRPGDLFVFVPPALLAVAVACVALGMVMLEPALLVLAVLSFALSIVTFVLTPFVELARGRRRSRR
jgi:hypothetical protein